MSKLIKFLLGRYVKKHPDIDVWTFSIDEYTDICVLVQRHFLRGEEDERTD